MTRIALRRAVIADAPTLASFWRDRYGETFGHLYPPADLAAFFVASYATERIAAEIADPAFCHHLALCDDDRLKRVATFTTRPETTQRAQGLNFEHCPTPLAEPVLSDNALVGAMKGGVVSLPVPDAGGLWELHRLYVKPWAQGTGLADRLMDLARAEARAAGANAIVLGVFSENERAKRFYARHGFEKIGAYQFAVGKTLDDEWIMLAPL